MQVEVEIQRDELHSVEQNDSQLNRSIIAKRKTEGNYTEVEEQNSATEQVKVACKDCSMRANEILTARAGLRQSLLVLQELMHILSHFS